LPVRFLYEDKGMPPCNQTLISSDYSGCDIDEMPQIIKNILYLYGTASGPYLCCICIEWICILYLIYYQLHGISEHVLFSPRFFFTVDDISSSLGILFTLVCFGVLLWFLWFAPTSNDLCNPQLCPSGHMTYCMLPGSQFYWKKTFPGLHSIAYSRQSRRTHWEIPCSSMYMYSCNQYSGSKTNFFRIPTRIWHLFLILSTGILVHLLYQLHWTKI
jgi:hypothetical protein